MKIMDNKLDIFYENNLVASIINLNDVEEGLSFFTHDEANIQFGTWNYKKGKELEPHFHNKFDRNATITQEAVFVLKGKVQCDLYNKKGQFISSHVLENNDLMIQFNEVHKYIMQEDSIVLEFKNGPYFGPEIDRTRIEIDENKSIWE